ncbi:aspartate/glutamate racemase family protein [Klebsiella sp. BIGb0407]|uniref:aspartate/glutamate racemase family protein n=1 Tax=Klebsiella sp. BIGb0407 TaxID=2940603 RepID=UPI002167C2B7|nr:aspartate/glutamate racemase family protein [Klebsiella sp. BIGb0407]MCS3431694.1 Asp/Glu/hydantoin racemase [Klebsiella sp. BIGb0407]
MTGYKIALINPNSSVATSEMMGRLAEACLPDGFRLQVITAEKTPEMLVTTQDITLAKLEVERLAMAVAKSVDAIVVGAFGDPALSKLREVISVPAIGIGEASLLAASLGQRPFAVVTVTPGLRDSISGYIGRLELSHLCRGVFITEEDASLLMDDPRYLEQQLYQASLLAIAKGAEAIVIGGGPLAPAAERLKTRLPVPVISPLIAGICSAVEQISKSPKS